MPTRLLHPLLFFIARKTGAELAPVVEYLKAENEILRSMLPKHIRVAPQDRAKLLKLGQAIGAGLRFLITIVTYTTFLKWCRDQKQKPKRQVKPVGRPKTDENLEDLVLRIHAETGWGYARIEGELRKLGFKKPCRSTIKNILISHGIDPSPKRGKGSWADFIERHAKTLWACDFLSKKIWTKSGFVDCFALFFIHVATRRVYLGGVTVNPSVPWVAQQGRNFVMHLEESPEATTKGEGQFILIHDLDGKFNDQFDRILKDGGVRIKKLPAHSPNLNAYAERWVQSFRVECLDQFMVFGVKHFEYLAREYVAWYNSVRPHQNRGNVPLPVATAMAAGQPLKPGCLQPEANLSRFNPSQIACERRCGGLLKHYYRKAA